MTGTKHVDTGENTPDGLNQGPDSVSGRSDSADPDTGQRQQDSAHYTGAPHGGNPHIQAGRDGGIVSTTPESNVGPPGAPQSSRGSAGKPGDDETR